MLDGLIRPAPAAKRIRLHGKGFQGHFKSLVQANGPDPIMIRRLEEGAGGVLRGFSRFPRPPLNHCSSRHDLPSEPTVEREPGDLG
jgi:hypothetical protein